MLNEMKGLAWAHNLESDYAYVVETEHERLQMANSSLTMLTLNWELAMEQVWVASDYQVKADLTSLVQAQDTSFRVKLIF